MRHRSYLFSCGTGMIGDINNQHFFKEAKDTKYARLTPKQF